MPPRTRRAATDAREARLVEVERLALDRHTEREIAALLGVSKTTIATDLATCRERWQDSARALRARHVEQELRRLERDENMLRSDLAAAEKLDKADRIDVKGRVHDRLLKLMERRSKLLGLDAPARTETIVETKAESNPLVEAAKTNEEVRKHLDAAAAAIYAPKPEAPKSP